MWLKEGALSVRNKQESELEKEGEASIFHKRLSFLINIAADVGVGSRTERLKDEEQ